MKEISTVKELVEDKDLMKCIVEDLEDFDENSPVTYAVWAIGYTADSEITDTDMFIGEFIDPDRAIEKAKALTVADIVYQAAEENDGSEPANDVAYVSIEVETVVDDEEEGTMNVGTIYKRDLWLSEVEEDEYSEIVFLREADFTLLEDGSIEVPCEILMDFNKNDVVQFMFIEENKDSTPILTYKIISKTTSNKYICEFIY